MFAGNNRDGQALLALGTEFISRIRELAEITGRVYVRSSVIRENIWDRGRYDSIKVALNSVDFEQRLAQTSYH